MILINFSEGSSITGDGKQYKLLSLASSSACMPGCFSL